jgi:hypothetical protein
MILLFISPFLSILGVLVYAYFPHEKQWREDMRAFQYESLRHDYYMKTGERMPTWSRVLPAIKVKGGEEIHNA